MSFIGLTTCPSHASGNVGDRLITEASIQLIEEICGPTEFNIHFRREDFTSRLDYINQQDGIICFGFPVLESSTRPKIYRIAENLGEVEPPIIPIGAVHNFFPGDIKELNSRELESSTKSFLDRVVKNCPNNEIPVRTEWVGEVLNQNGYKTILTGDPAWFDPDYIGDSFHRPDNIEQLVFTTPHSELYLDQAKKLLKRLTHQFGGSNRVIVLHSAPTDVDRELIDYTRDMGWDVQYASHNVENLELYRKSDLHVGYRKHGHLAHLRWRRPSIVLAEDSRAQGLNETLGTAGFPAFRRRKEIPQLLGQVHDWLPVKATYFALGKIGYSSELPPRRSIVAPPNSDAIDSVFDFITKQQENSWETFSQVGETIDETYKEGMKPFLESALKPLS